MGASSQADVVVIGGGLAGMAAAIELLDKGKRVLLLERDEAAEFGGQARRSFGGMFFVGTPHQRLSGFKDTPERALADWLSYAELGPDDHWPRRWAELYVHQCTQDVYRWLTARGVSFFPVVHWVERGYDVPGNSLPRFHMAWGTGEGIVSALRRHLEGHPRRSALTLRFRQRVEKLTLENGVACGCEGVDETTGLPFAVRAEAVVVASGGFTGDLARVRAHWPGLAPGLLLNGSHPYADGMLQDEAASHGARLTHLENMWHYAAGVRHPAPQHPGHGLSLIPPRSALWINSFGQRIGPPALVAGFDTRHLVKAIAREPGGYSWQVLNRRIAVKELAVSGAEFNDAMREKRLLGFLLSTLRGNPALFERLSQGSPDFVVANDVASLTRGMNELAGAALIQPDALEAELRRFDALDASDDQRVRLRTLSGYFGERARLCRNQPILDPAAGPLVAIRLQILARKSLGGIQTDLESRVLNEDGQAIPGLYAVGEASGFGGGGSHGRRALEGTFLGMCILTGRQAARAIGAAT